MDVLSGYADALILKIKYSGEFGDAVFYRGYDGEPAPSYPDGLSVCVSIGEIVKEKSFLSIYKRKKKTEYEAVLNFKVSAPSESSGLSCFCERLERALRDCDCGCVTKSGISAAKYDADLDAVYRIVTLQVRKYAGDSA